MMKLYIYYKYASKSYHNNEENIVVFENTLKKIQPLDNKNFYLIGLFNQILGAEECIFNKNCNLGIKYFQKAGKAFENLCGQIKKKQLFGVYNNIGAAFNFNGESEKALEYFKLANNYNTSNNGLLQKSYNYLAIAQTYQKLNNHDSAYYYFDKEGNALKDFNEYKNAISIINIEEKYKNEKLRADNLEIEKEAKQKENIAIGLASSLALGSIIAFLLFKNTKRKQRIAEQENELQSQKLATVLKEQELTAIDAMIEGQEKERQRIANDLHDDLGGLMTTVKWHFDALKEKQSTELFDKTNTLLDEAYQKIRGIVHAKNSGVIAKQGLLKAVKQMAEKVSALNKIQIQVVDHGLENRLENSLELTIFRIIQELTTNIIKHAQATEAMIHITNHEESLNILVEDNGKGFKPSQITKTNKGMGISSIDKRVEHLEGTMTIESEPKKGTTIIIDIPL